MGNLWGSLREDYGEIMGSLWEVHREFIRGLWGNMQGSMYVSKYVGAEIHPPPPQKFATAYIHSRHC